MYKNKNSFKERVREKNLKLATLQLTPLIHHFNWLLNVNKNIFITISNVIKYKVHIYEREIFNF